MKLVSETLQLCRAWNTKLAARRRQRWSGDRGISWVHRMRAEFLALKHESRILGHSSNPVCIFSMTEQVRLTAVWPTENWLGSSLNQIQGWTTVWESYSRYLEQIPLCVPHAKLPTLPFWSDALKWKFPMICQDKLSCWNSSHPRCGFAQWKWTLQAGLPYWWSILLKQCQFCICTIKNWP